jgi:hypothetical protein
MEAFVNPKREQEFLSKACFNLEMQGNYETLLRLTQLH